MYELVVKNEKERTYRLIRHLLVFLNLAGLLILVISEPQSFKRLIMPYFSIVISGIYIVLIFIERIAKKPGFDILHKNVFIWSAYSWFLTDLWFIAVVLLIFLFLDILALRQLVIRVTPNFVQLPVLPKKKLPWHQINNVILKDGMLTVDQRNNKLFQQPILNSDWDVSEEKFNEFCAAHIKLNHSNPSLKKEQ